MLRAICCVENEGERMLLRAALRDVIWSGFAVSLLFGVFWAILSQLSFMQWVIGQHPWVGEYWRFLGIPIFIPLLLFVGYRALLRHF